MKLYDELAEYYFAIEEKHRNIEDDIDLIMSFLSSRDNPSILDLGCGSGEHLNLLSLNGINCIGIDNSLSMLDIAKQRFLGSIEFVHEDMRFYESLNKFDMIISLFGSMNYIIQDSDVDRIFSNTWNALKPGGIGIFEIWNSIPLRKIKEKPLSKVSTINCEHFKIVRERGFKLLNYLNKTVVEVKYNYIFSNDYKISDRHVMRAYTKEEVENFIIEAGFEIRDIYSNTLKDTYNETSNAILIIFEKVL